MNNTITLCGYVGKDPEERLFEETEKKLARFSLAVRQFSKGKEEPMWIDCEAWNGLSDKVMTCIKGKREVVVFGALAIQEYNMKDGTRKSKPVVKMTGFYLAGKGSDSKPQSESES